MGKFIRLMILNCILVDNDAIKLFFYYMAWFMIYSIFAYTIEKLLELQTVVMWYDLLALGLFTVVYAYNIHIMILKISTDKEKQNG